jgi:putative transposase
VKAMRRDQLNEDEWQDVVRHADVLRRLPLRPTAGEVADAMAELAISRATLFRWLKRYRTEGRAAAPINRKSGRPGGIDPFDPALKTIVDRNIAAFYATPERPTLSRLRKRIAADCSAEHFPPPSNRRLKGYLATPDVEAMTRRREGKAGADAQFLALPGEFSAQHPLQVVQIDHTKVDVTVVDPIERQPIGRPILSIAIDVYTRMVLGFYLSIEAPSVTSVALCLTHAIIDKTRWLEDRGIVLEWPTSGLPMHSCRQWCRIPCARVQAGLRRP